MHSKYSINITHLIDHPLTSKVHIEIGELFEELGDKKTALENYQKASTCSRLDIAVNAYNHIGHICVRAKNYELAHSNYMKALKNLECRVPRIEPFLATEYTFLSANHESARQAVINLISKFFKGN